VVGVADVAPHRQAEELAHEMVLETSADDLPLIREVFRSDEADDAVDQEWQELPSETQAVLVNLMTQLMLEHAQRQASATATVEASHDH